RCIDGGKEETFRAEKEVIVCGGAIGSPHLLLLSGIGPAAELAALGIKTVCDPPGVGKNPEDHVLTPRVCEARSAEVRPLSVPRLLGWMASYALSGGGPLAQSVVQAGAFVRSEASAPRPDTQYHFTPWGTPYPNTDEERPIPKGKCLAILPGLI